METREGAEGYWSARESRLVAVSAEEGVDACEAAGRAAHVVVGGDEAFAKFVPCKFYRVSKLSKP